MSMQVPVALESCGVFMFPICLARRDFCFLLACGHLSVLGQFAQNLEFLPVPAPALCSSALGTRRLLLCHRLFYELQYYSLSLLCLQCDNRRLKRSEFKLIITGFLVCEEVSEGCSIIPSLLPSDDSLSTFRNIIYEFICRQADLTTTISRL